MPIRYTSAEIEELVRDHRLTLEPSDDAHYSIPATDLLDRGKTLLYLSKIAAIFEGKTEAANASLFAKRYSFLIVASSLFAMSRFDKSVDYAIENCHVESFRNGQAWLPKVRLSDWNPTCPGEQGREAWRDEVIRKVFAGNLAKAWRSLSKTASVSKAVLWENTAIYVYWLYENKFAEGADEERKAQVLADYDYLVHSAPAALFGETYNPLARFDSPKVNVPGEEKPIRPRKTCCLYYLASDTPNDYCPSCPKLLRERASSG